LYGEAIAAFLNQGSFCRSHIRRPKHLLFTRSY